MKTVLLTGASGYIGQFAVPFLLAKNYRVHTVSSKIVREENAANLTRHQANLLDANAVENLLKETQPTHLLHLAWYVEHGKFWNAPENLVWLAASLHLAREFVKNGGQRIIAAGTCAEYDWTEKGIFIENRTAFRPQTLYGAAKYSLALTLEKYAAVSDCSFASGKIFFPFGASESRNRLIPSVICSLLKNEAAKTSHGEQIRDFLYVETIAEAFVELLDGEVSGAVNIASGAGLKLREVVETLGEIIGKAELLQIGAIPAAENDPPQIVADTKRLREEVGFRKDSDLRERLAETVEYWKKNL